MKTGNDGDKARSEVAGIDGAMSDRVVEGSRVLAGKSASPWKTDRIVDVALEASVEIADGVANMEIPEEIFDEAELLWKCYVVGYFIGDAPHV